MDMRAADEMNLSPRNAWRPACLHDAVRRRDAQRDPRRVALVGRKPVPAGCRQPAQNTACRLLVIRSYGASPIHRTDENRNHSVRPLRARFPFRGRGLAGRWGTLVRVRGGRWQGRRRASSSPGGVHRARVALPRRGPPNGRACRRRRSPRGVAAQARRRAHEDVKPVAGRTGYRCIASGHRHSQVLAVHVPQRGPEPLSARVDGRARAIGTRRTV